MSVIASMETHVLTYFATQSSRNVCLVFRCHEQMIMTVMMIIISMMMVTIMTVMLRMMMRMMIMMMVMMMMMVIAPQVSFRSN